MEIERERKLLVASGKGWRVERTRERLLKVDEVLLRRPWIGWFP